MNKRYKRAMLVTLAIALYSQVLTANQVMLNQLVELGGVIDNQKEEVEANSIISYLNSLPLDSSIAHAFITFYRAEDCCLAIGERALMGATDIAIKTNNDALVKAVLDAIAYINPKPDQLSDNERSCVDKVLQSCPVFRERCLTLLGIPPGGGG